MSALRYPLDVARQSLWHQIANQALPARPEGFFLSEQLYRASLHPYTPISIGLLYLFGVVWANQRYRAQKGKSKDYVNASPTLKNIVLAHNILLAVYSCWTSVNVVARLVSYFSRGFKAGGAEGESSSSSPDALGGLAHLMSLSLSNSLQASLVPFAPSPCMTLQQTACSDSSSSSTTPNFTKSSTVLSSS